MVKRRRHLAKAITWRISATLITAAVAYIITGQFALAFTIGSFDFAAKFAWYYLHERIWYKSSWGITDSEKTH